MKSKRKSAALVLSGGGSLGIAHIGALRRLEKEYDFTHYFGVSAGAIVCAAVAYGMSADEISEIVHSLRLFPLSFDFSSTDFGIIRGEKVMKFLETVFKDTTFEDLQSQGKFLYIYATDFDTGERVCFSSGKIVPALRASISVPILFEPFFYDQKWLVDGGLSGNLPLFEAIETYAGNSIMAVDVGTSLKPIDFSEKKFFGKPASLRKILERTFRILYKTQQSCIPNDSRVQLLCPDLSEFTTLDLNKWKAIEKKGEECVFLCE